MKKVLTLLVFMGVITLQSNAKDISTYLYAGLQSASSVKDKLISKQFDIIGEYDAMGDSNYHVIVYTNSELKELASLTNRGFAAVLKVMISQNENQIVFTNSEYFLHAFLQNEYKKDVADNINNKLVSLFGELKPSLDALDDKDISDYHFSFGMPYYEDMDILAQGNNLKTLIRKNATNNLVFELQLNHSTLFGISMLTENGEHSFLSKIEGEKHAVYLPYMILVEDNKAKILPAKYYMSVAFPKLSFGEFMSIASTPDDINSYLELLFKK